MDNDGPIEAVIVEDDEEIIDVEVEEEEVEYRSNREAYDQAKEILGDLSLPMLKDSDLQLTANTDPLTAYLARRICRCRCSRTPTSS